MPVVRLQGVIAADQRAGRLNIAERRAAAAARLRRCRGNSRRHHRQFAGRLAGAVAPDHQAHPRSRRRERQASAGLRRGRRGLGRLFHRHRRRRDHRRSLLDRRLDRRDLCRLRLCRRMEKLGVERRVHTAGKNKSTLDPFLPEKPEDIERIKADGARNPSGLHRLGEVAPRQQAQGGRRSAVHRRVLERRSRPRARAHRCARRSARNAAHPLRRRMSASA